MITSSPLRLFYLKVAFLFGIILMGLQLQASAQIAFLGKSQLKAETRRNLREAARIEADYKESHLNTTYFTYKKGKAGRKRVDVVEGWENYQYNNPNQSTYLEPVKWKFKRTNRKKK